MELGNHYIKMIAMACVCIYKETVEEPVQKNRKGQILLQRHHDIELIQNGVSSSICLFQLRAGGGGRG